MGEPEESVSALGRQ